MTANKFCLQVIAMLMEVILTFFSVFFAIYIYDLSQNLHFVLGYTLFESVCFLIFEIIGVYLINKKNFNLIFRGSFLLILVAIALIFFINPQTIFMVFVVQGVYALANVGYYLPQEVALMSCNADQKSLHSFVGISQILGVVAGVLSPLLSGIVIDKISYPVLLVLITILAAICFFFSFGVRQSYAADATIKISDYCRIGRQIPKVHRNYWIYGIYRFSQNSVVDLFLPILLFIRVGTNLSVGVYAALAALLSGIIIWVYLLLMRHDQRYQDWLLILCTMLLVSMTVVLVIWPSLVVFFIYYFTVKCCRVIIKQNIDPAIFGAINGTVLEPYKKQHHLLANWFGHLGKIIAYVLALFLYHCWPTMLTLSLIVLGVTLCQNIVTVMLLQTRKQDA